MANEVCATHMVEVRLDDLFIDEDDDDRTKEQLEQVVGLGENMKRVGQTSPITVVPQDGKYRIVAGKRRYYAAKKMQMDTLLAWVAPEKEHPITVDVVSDNLFNRPIADLLRARQFRKLLDRGDYENQGELAVAFGVSQSYISKQLKLLEEDSAVQEAITNKEISKTALLQSKKIRQKQEREERAIENIDDEVAKVKERKAERKKTTVPDEFLMSSSGERHNDKFKVALRGKRTIEITFVISANQLKGGIKEAFAQEVDLIGEQELTQSLMRFVKKSNSME